MLYEIFSTMLALVFVLSIPVAIVSGSLCLFSTKINATKWLKYSGITFMASLVMIYGCMAYEKTLEEQDMIAQLQAENAELNKQIEQLQAINEEHKECEANIEDLQTRYDNILAENACWIEENNKLKEQLNSVEETEEPDDEVAVAEETEEHKEATNSNNNLSNAYGTVGHNSNYDSYYHDYSDCKFIRNKKVYQLTGEQVLNRTECKCVYSGRFWE